MRRAVSCWHAVLGTIGVLVSGRAEGVAVDGVDRPSAAVTMTPALVRLLAADGQCQGLGLLVAEREILTCAHVVSLAVGSTGEPNSRPDGPVDLDFPVAAPGRRYTADVVAWQAPAPDGSGDVAGLRLRQAPPEAAIPCAPVGVDDVYGHRFHVFGFTSAHPTGVWVSGEIRGPDLVGNLVLSGDPIGPRMSPGFSGTPVWDEHLQAVVGLTTRVTIGRASPGGYCATTSQLIAAWPEVEDWIRPPCPYRSLLPLRESDEGHFFGRDQISDQLAAQLPRRRFSVLLGPSGCGKSSVVRAGVVPRLRRRGDLLIAGCRPGLDPGRALRTAVTELLESEPSATDHADGGLAVLAERALEDNPLDRLFLIVDQFEELYAHPKEVAADFVLTLRELAASSRPDGRPLCNVLLVARADFADRLTSSTEVTRALALGRADPAAGIHHLLPMTDAELRQAVERPVERLRVVRYEDGLVDRLMRDVQRLENPLALLAFTLVQLWDSQRRGRLTLAAYERMGEVAGALSVHFDRIYDEELDDDEREVARLLVLRLTTPDGRGGHVRRPVRRSDLDSRYWLIAQRLAGRRLLSITAGPDQNELVELAHDALLVEWPRLAGWLREEREFLEWYDRLRRSIELWEAADRAPARMLSRAELAQTEPASRRWADRLLPYEKEFIERSRAQERQRRLRRALVGAAAALLALALVAALGVAALQARQRTADRAAQNVRDLVSGLRYGNVLLELPTALAAYRVAETPTALRALGEWQSRSIVVEKLLYGDLRVTSLEPGRTTVSPDARYAIVPWSLRERAMLWDLDRSTVPVPAPGGADPGTYAFSPDGTHLLYPQQDRLVFWSLRQRAAHRSIPLGLTGDDVDEVIAGTGVVGVVVKEQVYVLDARTGKRLAGPVPAARQDGQDGQDGAGLRRLRFDADERRLFVLGVERPAAVDLATGRVGAAEEAAGRFDPDHPECVGGPGVIGRLPLSGHGVLLNGPCDSYQVGADRVNDELLLVRDAATAESSAVLEIRDRRTGREVRGRFPVPNGPVVGIAGSRKGARVVLEDENGLVLLRIPPPGSFARELSRSEAAVLTPDGRHVATWTSKGAFSLWHRRSGRLLRSIHHRLREPDEVYGGAADYSVITSPDGLRVAVVGGGAVRTIEVAQPYRASGWTINHRDGWRRNGARFPAMSAGFSDADDVLVQAGGVVSRWNAADGRRIGQPWQLPARDYGTWAARPGHPQLAIAREDNDVIELWDVATRSAVATWRTKSTTGGRANLVFDPTGRLAGISWSLESDAQPASVSAPATVLDVTNGRELARLPHFDADNELATADQAVPLTFAKDGLLLTDGSVVYEWDWRGRGLPLVSGTAIDAVSAAPFGELTLSGGALLHRSETSSGGWFVMPASPRQWHAELCGKFAGAIMLTRHLANRFDELDVSACRHD